MSVSRSPCSPVKIRRRYKKSIQTGVFFIGKYRLNVCLSLVSHSSRQNRQWHCTHNTQSYKRYGISQNPLFFQTCLQINKQWANEDYRWETRRGSGIEIQASMKTWLRFIPLRCSVKRRSLADCSVLCARGEKCAPQHMLSVKYTVACSAFCHSLCE